MSFQSQLVFQVIFVLVSAIRDLRRGHALESRKWASMEPVSPRCTPDQGDRSSRVLPLSVHYSGDCARAHRVCQVHSGVCGPLP